MALVESSLHVIKDGLVLLDESFELPPKYLSLCLSYIWPLRLLQVILKLGQRASDLALDEADVLFQLIEDPPSINHDLF